MTSKRRGNSNSIVTEDDPSNISSPFRLNSAANSASTESTRASFRDQRYRNSQQYSPSVAASPDRPSIPEQDGSNIGSDGSQNFEEGDCVEALQGQPSGDDTNDFSDENNFAGQVARMIGRPGAFAIGLTRVRSRRRDLTASGSTGSGTFSSYGHTNSFDSLPPAPSPGNSPRRARRGRCNTSQSGISSPPSISSRDVSFLGSNNAVEELATQIASADSENGGTHNDSYLKDDDGNPKRKAFYLGMILGGGILAIGLVATLILLIDPTSSDETNLNLTPNYERTPEPSLSPTTSSPTSLERIQSFKEAASFVSDTVLIETPGTAQYKAVYWLANDDPADLDPSTESSAFVQERYLVALLFFSLGIDSLPRDHPAKAVMNSGRSVCDWEFFFGNNDNSDQRWEADPLGVVCDRNFNAFAESTSQQIVTEIVMKRFGAQENGELVALNGTIPKEICSISSLKRLILIQIDLHGSIPEEISTCTKLEEIDIELNRITGTIPSSIGTLPLLRTLNLSRNDITGTIPSELGSLSNTMVSLSLGSNKLQDGIPSTLGSLSNLEVLDLSSNVRLGGTIPTDFGNLLSLASLRLRQTSLKNEIPSILGNLEKLTYLDLAENGLDGTIPTELGRMENLMTIDLEFNFLSGFIPAFPTWNRLETLLLRGNRLNGSLDQLCNANPGVIACSDCMGIGNVQCLCCEAQNCCDLGGL